MHRHNGFTLIEIAAVLVIIAILSTLAVKHMGGTGMSAYGEADRLVADLRYAQSLAMTRAQAVTVTVKVSCDSGESCWYLEGEEGELPFADGETERTVHDPKVSIAADTTVEFQYPDGKVDSDQTLTLQQGSHSIDVKVYGGTGYVEIQ
jgi:prepilin-type N-terminal cleavage/methylation domain-containing protein